MATRSKVFICYDPSTETYVEELRDNLTVLEREDRLDVWDPSRLKPGDRWREEIAAAIEQTRIAVLFVSPPFNRKFVFQGQLPALLEAAKKDGAKIIPVYAEPCLIPKELSPFRFLNPPRPGAKVAANEIGKPRRQQLWVDLASAIQAEFQRSPVDRVTMIVAVDEQEEPRAQEILADLTQHPDLRFQLETWSRIDDGERATWRDRLGEDRGIPGLLIFVGARGLGIWSDPDLRRALRAFNRTGKPLVFILLSGQPADLPGFLARRQVLDAAAETDHEQSVEKIARLILTPDYSEKLDEPGGDLPEPRVTEGEEQTEPAEPGRTQEDNEAEIEVAVKKIREELDRSENLTFFVGAGIYPVKSNGSGKNGEKPDAGARSKKRGPSDTELHPLRLSAITHSLLDGLDLDYQEVLPPVDVVGDYYDIHSPEGNELDRTLKALCMKTAKEKGPTSTHKLIADAFKTLSERQKRDPLLVTRPPVHLIVTTNFDLMMERSLLEAGVAFTRIVQHRSGDQFDINEYREVRRIGDKVLIQTPHEQQAEDEKEQTRLVDLGDVDDFYDAIEKVGIRRLEPLGSGEGVSDLQSFDLEGYTSPYLYKHHGSVDIDGSCAATTEQYFEFIRQVFKRGIIPERIKQILSSGPILFFGYSVLDPDFRVTMHTLLRGNPDPKHRYSIQPTPSQDSADRSERVEARFWENLRRRAADDHSIKIVEARCEDFLTKFIAEL